MMKKDKNTKKHKKTQKTRKNDEKHEFWKVSKKHPLKGRRLYGHLFSVFSPFFVIFRVFSSFFVIFRCFSKSYKKCQKLCFFSFFFYYFYIFFILFSIFFILFLLIYRNLSFFRVTTRRFH